MHGATGFIATALIRIVEVMFAIGVVGSVVVIILSTVEDAEMLKEKDET